MCFIREEFPAVTSLDIYETCDWFLMSIVHAWAAAT